MVNIANILNISMLACWLLLDMWLEISHWSCYRGHVWLLNGRTWQSSRSLTDLQIQPNPVGSSVFSSTLYENVTEDWQAAFVFNIFIRLFSLFLFVLKFILSLLDLFFFFPPRLQSSNSSKQNHQKWFYVHLADIPIGFTRVSFDNCGPTLCEEVPF